MIKWIQPVESCQTILSISITHKFSNPLEVAVDIDAKIKLIVDGTLKKS